VRLGEAARQHGKAVAMAVDTIEAVREVIALGATIVNYSSDVGVLRGSYAAAVAEIRRPKERS
jgi:2-keto-3-deoxy-L-rhamnonate aldolase RhmA